MSFRKSLHGLKLYVVYTHWNLQSSEYVRDELGRGRPDLPPDSSPPSTLLSVLLAWLFARFTSRPRFSLLPNPFNLSSSVLMDIMSFEILAINWSLSSSIPLKSPTLPPSSPSVVNHSLSLNSSRISYQDRVVWSTCKPQHSGGGSNLGHLDPSIFRSL